MGIGRNTSMSVGSVGSVVVVDAAFRLRRVIRSISICVVGWVGTLPNNAVHMVNPSPTALAYVHMHPTSMF